MLYLNLTKLLKQDGHSEREQHMVTLRSVIAIAVQRVLSLFGFDIDDRNEMDMTHLANELSVCDADSRRGHVTQRII